MPRPKRKRRIQKAPIAFGFIPSKSSDTGCNFDIELQLEEYESLRLADYKGLSQEEASVLMQVSRPTFTRIYETARKKIVTAMVENKSLNIAGGQVDFEENWYRCHECENVFSNIDHHCATAPYGEPYLEHINTSLNRGDLEPPFVLSTSSLGYCKCGDCGYKEEKTQGVPCRSKICPECGQANMQRFYNENKKNSKK